MSEINSSVFLDAAAEERARLKGAEVEAAARAVEISREIEMREMREEAARAATRESSLTPPPRTPTLRVRRFIFDASFSTLHFRLSISDS